MPLSGIKVLEFAGVAPGPFCGKLLADFGADVTVIDRVLDNVYNVLSLGKRTLSIDLKKPLGQKLIRELSKTHDVLIDPFRPGVMEKLNLGPDLLCNENPRLIYARLTGFGQTGPLAPRATHELNVIAMSGVLSMLARKHEKPMPPINVIGDTAGGSLLCAFGICLAIVERSRSGRGQVIDAAMMDGAAYIASWLFMTRNIEFIWKSECGDNLFDGRSYFYDTYECQDGKYMSVAPLEQHFFDIFKERLGLPQLLRVGEDDSQGKYFKALITAAFLQKTQAQWSAIFEDADACVYPVLEWQDVMDHNHVRDRESFQLFDDIIVPNPAPRLSRTPGKLSTRSNGSADAIEEALNLVRNSNLSQDELQQLVAENVIILPLKAKL